MRDRMRELEVALAMVELEALSGEGARLSATLEENVTERDGAAARVAALEADIETCRAESAEADRALSGRQREVDELAEEARRLENENVVRRERRESLLADSRRLASEREELAKRVEATAARRAELDRALEERVLERDAMKERLAEAEARLSRLEGDLDSRKTALSRSREGLEAASQEVGRVKAELSNLATHGEHIADRDAVLSGEIGEIETSRTAREVQLAEAREDVTALRREAAELERAAEEARARAEELESRREELREQESALAVGVESQRSALEMLRELQSTHEGFGRGARSLLSRGNGFQALADCLHPTRPDLIAALDSALETALQFVVCPSSAEAVEGVRALKNGEGRATLVDLAGFRSSRSVPRYGALPADAAILGSARSFLEVSGDLAFVLDELLASTYVVETLDDAVRLAKRPDTRGFRFVSRDGDWAEHPGIIHGGSRQASADSRILGRADRIEELARRIADEDSMRAALASRIEELARERRHMEEEAARLDERRDEIRERLAAREMTIQRLDAEMTQDGRRMESVRGEREGLAGRRAELASRRESLEQALERAEGQRLTLEEEWQKREEELVASTEDRDEAQRVCHRLGLDEQRTCAELEKLSLEAARLDESRAADEEAIANRSAALAETDQAVGELARGLEEGLAQAAAKSGALEELRAVRDRVAEGRTRVLDRLRELEGERGRWARLREQAAELVHENEMSLTKLTAAREELTGRVARELEVDLGDPRAAEEHGALLSADEETREDARREREELRKQIERMGAVNLVALEQYDREARRLEFLETQKNDLETAREKLRRTIRKINRTARTLFMQTLEQVRINFQQTFGDLFEGGQADIRLAGDEDPLHAPIEIFARPRGKRLSNISLLSSGERSLTAVAFLFAIYLVKPSPFCILDEVDAPLDDANIGRFLAMLRQVAQKTQFVMITHNKKTMEVADYLYGVTMEEPGVSKLVSVRLGRGSGYEPPEAAGDGTEAERELVMEGAG
jgi:chromosome segregation protein